ncbi:MAG TPA: hypothetical protein DCY13_20445 [Verrucomicrobiales bacterium]|nr:hypothetical protein [Verrucomicrobiales bacterium]
MKLFRQLPLTSMLALLVAAGVARSPAQDAGDAAGEPDSTPTEESSVEPVKVEQVSVKNGVLHATGDEGGFTPTNSVVLPFDVKVRTNLTFTVSGGKARKLQEGQTIRKDGTLQSPDGSVMPVVDHVAVKNGQVVIVKDGERSKLDSPTRLADGSRIEPDGTMVSPGGSRTRLLDGQLFKLSGESFPATDTATLMDGQVVLQKDGSKIQLRTTQMMMMSDGTKVHGNGRVEYRDGRTLQLAEGQTIRTEGVRR